MAERQIYEYKGQKYDLSSGLTNDEALNKIKTHLGEIETPKVQETKTEEPKIGFFGDQKIIDPEKNREWERENLFIKSPSEYIPGLKFVEDAGSKALRDIVSSVGTLPTDIYSFAADKLGLPGSEKASEISSKIDATIPDVKVSGGEELAADVSRYMFGGLTGGKKALDLTKKLVTNKKAKYGVALGGAVAGDMVVTTPDDATTIGTEFTGGPTAIQKGDSNLTKRFKVGIETLVAGPVADLVLRGVLFPVLKKGKNVVDQVVKPLTKKGQNEMVGKLLAETYQDPKTKTYNFIKKDQIIKNLEDGIEEAKRLNIKPTTGTIADNIQLLGYEKGLGNNPRLVAQRVENNIRLSKELNDLNKKREIGEGFERFFTNEKDALLYQQKKIQKQFLEAETEVQNIVDEFAATYPTKTGDSASIKLNEIIKKKLDDITLKKNEYFDAIDPNYSVIVPRTDLKEVVKSVLKAKSRGDQTAVDALKNLPVIKNLKTTYEKTPKLNAKGKPIKDAEGNVELVDPKPLTYGELQDFRADLSDAIGNALKNDQGKVATKLSEIKKILQDYTEIVADAGGLAAGRAKTALNFYKKTYVPQFRNSIGNDFREAMRSSQAWPESLTASKFILGRPGGSLEAIENLSKIVKTSGSVAQANKAVNDYVAAQLARQVLNTKGNVVPKKLIKFKDNYSQIFKVFPGTKSVVDEFETAVKKGQIKSNDLGQKVLESKDKLALNSAQQQLSSLELVINKNPLEAIKNVFTSRNPSKQMKELIDLAKKDKTGEALLGLKTALREWNWQKNTTTKYIPGTEIFETSRASVTEMLKNTSMRNALSQLYTPSEMKRLEDIQKQLNIFDRINMQITTGSPSTPLAEASNRLRIVLASWYGIVKGRGIFAISQFVGKNVLGINPKEAAEKLVVDVMLDPSLAITMLKKYSPTNQKEINQKISSYIANNFIAELPGAVYDEITEE
jgi:hypothetical protein